MIFLCSVQYDYLIIGQGICGTLLSYELIKKGKSVLVFDDGNNFSSSKVASGLINPVTGKRFVKSWLYDQLLNTALQTYSDLEEQLGISLINNLALILFHTSIEERSAFNDRCATEEYLYETDLDWSGTFNYHFGAGKISPCYIIDSPELLNGWRNKLRKQNILVEEKFDWNNCVVNKDCVFYKDIRATKIICCEGAASLHNSYFSLLPFSLNKGEAVIANIPGLQQTNIYKHRYKLIPIGAQSFWIGASFEWKYDNILPTNIFLQNLTNHLTEFLKLPCSIEDHVAAERPSSIDHKPFAGLHPQYPSVAILNGMGTKGFSQAPFFAKHLANHLCNDSALMPDVDILRFKRLLTRV